VQGQADVFEAGQCRQQIEELKDESDIVAPHAGQIVVGQPIEHSAVDEDLAVVGLSSPPIRFRSVDLPDPERPMTDTISSAAIVRLTSASAATRRFPSNCFTHLLKAIMAGRTPASGAVGADGRLETDMGGHAMMIT
jgi:hypothetical protein